MNELKVNPMLEHMKARKEANDFFKFVMNNPEQRELFKNAVTRMYKINCNKNQKDT